jgi:hypothetical protein
VSPEAQHIKFPKTRQSRETIEASYVAINRSRLPLSAAFAQILRSIGSASHYSNSRQVQ